MTVAELRCLRDDVFRFMCDYRRELDPHEIAALQIVLRVLAALSRMQRPIDDTCDLCGGEGIVDGLVAGDSIRTETCRRCRGTGNVRSTQ